ncbi:hypothetical protein KZ483_25280 [Paenibacillus sp. sptzw28]|uniref:hypothetical protein n=1 Tax=Paenibacillus sp. sptzw28 TaxID=715179 RepID=UPI001C6F0B3C|nr:hypothetical protein [Paenibacillus sp. sptzw28]QYR21008.1 hypothetical protein KZ483_25280 [Paenibacillus sp. sptzw28]
MKRISSVFLALVCVLAVPFSSSAFASGEGANDKAAAAEVYIIRANGVTTMAAGEWDYLGARSTSSSENPSNYVFSGGGDFKYKVYSGPSGGAWYQLREYDPNNADDIITDPNGYSLFYLYPGDTLVYRGISGAVDGDNNKAEFYVKESFSGAATVQYWD